MWPFKKKPESPEEIAAEEKLDRVTREVAAAELDKEAAVEAVTGGFSAATGGMIGNPLQPLEETGAMSGPLHGDPDPVGEKGLRETPDQTLEEKG
ncbi:MAG: hypothetical protein QOG85_946 [Gaiellaceae bacterium]|jgi:hypothetical protein|nr:hypothetical protein [Gaiellaceae bacterium]